MGGKGKGWRDNEGEGTGTGRQSLEMWSAATTYRSCQLSAEKGDALLKSLLRGGTGEELAQIPEAGRRRRGA